jgi:hypothetical protein
MVSCKEKSTEFPNILFETDLVYSSQHTLHAIKKIFFRFSLDSIPFPQLLMKSTTLMEKAWWGVWQAWAHESSCCMCAIISPFLIFSFTHCKTMIIVPATGIMVEITIMQYNSYVNAHKCSLVLHFIYLFLYIFMLSTMMYIYWLTKSSYLTYLLHTYF